MALSRAPKNQIPADAVIMSEDEALAFQWKIITKWEKTSEVYGIKTIVVFYFV